MNFAMAYLQFQIGINIGIEGYYTKWIGYFIFIPTWVGPRYLHNIWSMSGRIYRGL